MSDYALFIAVFLACLVEAVEAMTIVLAAGTARDWRSAMFGVGAGLLVLTVIIVVFGPAIASLPLQALRLVVGGLLLVFGLQWLRKAILRASGYKALHDEDAIFQRELVEARAAARGGRAGIDDWYAFTLSFKGVLLEGLEVAFIVLTFGTIQHRTLEASLAALAAVVVVVIAGVAIKGPLSRVPENTMKFVVGVMLTSFGIFWGAEGAGATWPGADAVLFAIIPAVGVVAVLLVAILRRRRSRSGSVVEVHATVAAGSVDAIMSDAAASELSEPAGSASDPVAQPVVAPARTGFTSRVVAVAAFLYDFIVGDDWRVTVGIVLAFALTAWVGTFSSIDWLIVPLAVVVLMPFGTLRAISARS